MSVYDDEERRRRWYPIVAGVVIVAFLLSFLMRFGGGSGAVAPLEPGEVRGVRAPGGTDGAGRSAAPVLESSSGSRTAAPGATPNPPVPAGHVDGRVIDAVTGEAVQDVEVRLACGEVSETVVTDALGMFRATLRYPSGELTAVVADDGPEVGRVTTVHDGSRGTHDWGIAVAIGPTYPIAVIDGSAPGEEDWTARIVRTCVPEGLSGVLDVRESDVTIAVPGDQRPDRKTDWRRVRGGGRTRWVRFASVPFTLQDGFRAILELRSETKSRKGRAKIGSLRGIHTPVVAATDRFVTIRGKVRWRNGPYEAPSVRVLAIPSEVLPSTREWRSVLVWDEAYDTGSGFVLRDVMPGAKTIVALAQGCLIASVAYDTDVDHSGPLELDMTTGASIASDIWLGLPQKLPELASSAQILRFTLQDVGPWVSRLVLTSGFDGRFDVPEVPLAPYEILDVGIDGPPHWETPVLTPSLFSDYELPITRPADTLWHTFAARDRLTKEPIARFGVSFGPRGAMIATAATPSEAVKRLSPRTEISFSVWKPGYQPAFGDQTSFKAAGDARVAEVDLHPGLGALLVFRAGDPSTFTFKRRARNNVLPWIAGALAAPPLCGVELEGPDGQKSYTDLEGEARIATTMQCSLALRSPGWQLAKLSKIDGVGNRWIVWMERRD